MDLTIVQHLDLFVQGFFKIVVLQVFYKFYKFYGLILFDLIWSSSISFTFVFKYPLLGGITLGIVSVNEDEKVSVSGRCQNWFNMHR